LLSPRRSTIWVGRGSKLLVDSAEVAREGSPNTAWFGSWIKLLRFAAPAFLIYVLYDAIPSTFRSIIALFGE
jgi:hypothetical protein